MDKKPEKLVPEVRFKGFTDDWEQHKLGDFGNVQMNKRIFKSQTLDSGDVPFYKIGTFGKKADAYISSELYEEYRNKYPYPKDGDLLISASGSIGKIVEYKGQRAYYQDSNIVWLDHDNRILNLFLKAFFQIVKWNGTEGSTIKRLYNKNILNTEIILPKIKEQTAVGKLIEKFDYLITLQQRKLEILIKLKRSFLTKSMANSLDKNPELYFNSASVKWLKQKLSDLTIKEFKGNTKLNDTKPGKTEYLDAERLNGNVPLFIDKPINTLKSDILILWDGSKAGSVYYGFEGSLGSTLKAIRLNPKLVNSFFVYQQLKSKQDVIFNKYRTPNIPHVIKNFTKVYPIYFPSMAVQNKIARFLGNLDTLIEIQQKSIKDHKVIKKYLLQKLFI